MQADYTQKRRAQLQTLVPKARQVKDGNNQEGVLEEVEWGRSLRIEWKYGEERYSRERQRRLERRLSGILSSDWQELIVHLE